MILNATHFTTPLGSMMACTSELGLCLLEFSDCPRLPAELLTLQKRLKASIEFNHHPSLQPTISQMGEYFSGSRQQFDLSLDMLGTDFQQRAWLALRAIPFGTTRSYSEQAVHIGAPTAVRAVARANGMNRLAIIIPCHRLIGADGSLTGYAGGLPRKQWLLDFERQHVLTAVSQ